MFVRTIRTSAIVVIAIAAMALPAAAFAGDQLSAVDALAADVAVDGSKNSTKPATETSAGDSPTTDTYSGGSTDSVPPPVTCGGSSGSTSSDTKPATGTSTKPATDTCTILECATGDTDGKDANGKPCVECSSVDTDGQDASGKPCVPATTTVTETPVTATETACTDGGGTGATTTPVTTGTTVCGGGGMLETPEALPATGEPVAGGGEPMLPAEPTAIGGGAPELPFTGLPLWYAIFGGLGLMLAGGALWARGRFGGGRA